MSAAIGEEFAGFFSERESEVEMWEGAIEGARVGVMEKVERRVERRVEERGGRAEWDWCLLVFGDM